jgi:hypothetical protein
MHNFNEKRSLALNQTHIFQDFVRTPTSNVNGKWSLAAVRGAQIRVDAGGQLRTRVFSSTIIF